MSTLARSIEIRGNRIYVDGIEFPWFVTNDPITSTCGPDQMTTVNLTLVAESFSTDGPLSPGASTPLSSPPS